MVGTWSASAVDISASGGSFAGGAGATWTIDDNGSEVIDWDRSGYFDIAGNPDYRYTGSQSDTVRIPTTAATTGTWSAHVDTDNRTALYSPQIASVTGKTSVPVPSTAGLDETGTWSCSGSEMTIAVTVEGSTVKVNLVRA